MAYKMGREKMNCEKCMERGGFSTMELTDADSDGEGMVYETYTCLVCGNVQYDAFRI